MSFGCKSEVVQGRGKLFGLEKWKWEWVCMCAESLEFACEKGLSFGLHFTLLKLFFFFFCGLTW